MDKLYFATGNSEKVKEARAILGIPIEIADIEVDEVQSMDLEYITAKKVEEAYKKLRKPVIVDDVGLYFDAFNGFPGPFIKFFADKLGNDGILELLKDEKNRGVTIQGAIGYHDGREPHVFVEAIRGTVSHDLKGKDGWGFDFYVVPNGYNQTFAEMGSDKKNQISHRAGAINKLKVYLSVQKMGNEV